MKTAVKAAVAAAMVMGISTFANAAGSNTGTVTFTGTIEDSPCSIVVGDEHQTVNLGHIGTGSLMGGKSLPKWTSRSVWKTVRSPLRKKRLPFSLRSVTNPALTRVTLR